jgi:hypothetical protein
MLPEIAVVVPTVELLPKSGAAAAGLEVEQVGDESV